MRNHHIKPQTLKNDKILTPGLSRQTLEAVGHKSFDELEQESKLPSLDFVWQVEKKRICKHETDYM